MALTKVTGQVIKNTTDVTVGVLTVTNTLAVGGTVSIGGTLTYEDVTNVDAVGLITARNGIVVGSGITLSKDGDIFATGITTVSGNVKVGTGITLSPDGDGFYTGVVTATTFSGDLTGDVTGSGANLTNLPAANITGTLPAISGANLTALNASNLASGTVPTARLGSGTASSSTFLAGDSTFKTVTGTTINTNAQSRVVLGSDTANELNAASDLTFTSNSNDHILTLTGTGQAHLNLITTSGTNHCSVNFGDSDDNDVGEILYTHSSNKMQFVTNATEKMVIERDGNVAMNDNLKVAGVCTATSFSGDGSGLTGISFSTESLTKTNGQTATLDLSKNDHLVTATGTVTIDTSGGTVSESHTLRIVNNGTATIAFSSKFLFPSGGTPALPTTSGAISLISFTVHQTSGTVKLLAGASVNFS